MRQLRYPIGIVQVCRAEVAFDLHHRWRRLPALPTHDIAYAQSDRMTEALNQFGDWIENGGVRDVVETGLHRWRDGCGQSDLERRRYVEHLGCSVVYPVPDGTEVAGVVEPEYRHPGMGRPEQTPYNVLDGGLRRSGATQVACRPLQDRRRLT